MTDIDAIRQRADRYKQTGAGSGKTIQAIQLANTDVPALLAELDQLAAYNRSVKGANADLRAELAEVRNQAHRVDTNHAQIVRANTELAAERDALKALLDLPCGSCHPCTNYADETWRAAGRKPPHVFEYDELLAEVKALRPVADAAAAWRRFTGDDSVRFSEETALIAAVDALPNLQEPCDICSSTAGGCPECKTDTTRGGA